MLERGIWLLALMALLGLASCDGGGGSGGSDVGGYICAGVDSDGDGDVGDCLDFESSFTVDSTADAVDANPGDGICADESGVCTLRATIMETNALAGADCIDVPSGNYALSIEGRHEDAAVTGDLDLTDDLAIVGSVGAATVIDGNELDRVFHLFFGSEVSISGVTVKNGSTDPATTDHGGGILNDAKLRLSYTVISENTATDGDGGGISNRNGTITIENSTISDNAADPQRKFGGGGGIDNGHIMVITDSTISGNYAGDEGGGIQNNGSISMRNSTVSGNKAPNSNGGGIANFRDGTLTAVNTTISGNVTGEEGGGIWNPSGAAALLISSTVAENEADRFGGIWSNGTTELRGTIVSNNRASSPGRNCSFRGITSLGYNLDSDGTCNLTQPTDFSNADARLGPLADNGGPTKTHALLAGSEALDGGEAVCRDAVGEPLTTDQRGRARPADANGRGLPVCDIGAFEC